MTTFTTQDRQDAQRTPLTDEQIMKIYYSVWDRPMEMEDIEKADITFARAIERAHGIGE